MRLLLLVFLAGLAPAQTSINAARSGCRGDQPRIVAEVPATVGTATVMVPLCLALGPTLSVDTSTDPPTLRAAVQPQQQPWLAVDRIPLEALALPGGSQWSYTLQRVPVEGSALLAIRVLAEEDEKQERAAEMAAAIGSGQGGEDDAGDEGAAGNQGGRPGSQRGAAGQTEALREAARELRAAIKAFAEHAGRKAA